MNKFTLIKKEEYDSLSNGKIAYRVNNYLLIETSLEFFEQKNGGLKIFTPGINYMNCNDRNYQ